MMENVAIIGATNKEGRYARLAQEMLIEYGHQVFPIARKKEVIQGKPAHLSVSEIEDSIDTVTLYVRPDFLEPHMDSIIKKQVKRVIMNPGTESESLRSQFEKAGIEVVIGCTLVMLKTGQF